MDTLLGVFGEPYIALVARTDVASDPNLRVSLGQNVDYLLSQPLLKTFSFETPAEAMQRLSRDSNFCGLRTPKKRTDATENEIVPLLRRLVLAHIANNRRTNLKIREQKQQIESLLVRVAERQGKVESLASQLVEKDKESRELAEHVAEGQRTVELLGTQLPKNHKKVRVLVVHVAESERALDSVITQLSENQNKVTALTAQLAEKEAELDKIKGTMGWRLLRQYGKIKYPYLMPIYRLLNLFSSRLPAKILGSLRAERLDKTPPFESTQLADWDPIGK